MNAGSVLNLACWYLWPNIQVTGHSLGKFVYAAARPRLPAPADLWYRCYLPPPSTDLQSLPLGHHTLKPAATSHQPPKARCWAAALWSLPLGHRSLKPAATSRQPPEPAAGLPLPKAYCLRAATTFHQPLKTAAACHPLKPAARPPLPPSINLWRSLLPPSDLQSLQLPEACRSVAATTFHQPPECRRCLPLTSRACHPLKPATRPSLPPSINLWRPPLPPTDSRACHPLEPAATCCHHLADFWNLPLLTPVDLQSTPAGSCAVQRLVGTLCSNTPYL